MDIDLRSCIRLLQSCASRGSVRQGRQIHLLLLKKGIVNAAVNVGNCLLQMYSRCGHTGDARQVFDEMPQRNCFTWNALIEGYMKLGDMVLSMELFRLMPDRDTFSWNMVVTGFAKAGDLDTARNFFDAMPNKNAIAWNSVIHGYERNGCPIEALRLFRDMHFDPLERTKADCFVMATVIRACTDMEAVDLGKQIHAQVITGGVEFDPGLASSLVNLYGKCNDLDSATQILNSMEKPDGFTLSALISGYAKIGKMDEAREIFNRVTNPGVVSWNSLISGHVSNNKDIEALVLFDRMRSTLVREDSSTLASVLGACSTIGALELGKQIHSHISKIGFVSDLIVASALIDMYYKSGSPVDACKFFSELRAQDTILLNTMITVYSNCGEIENAKRIFSSISCKSLISWNSMLGGLGQNGYPSETLFLFSEMNRLGQRMDKFSLVSAVSACASISSFDLGEQIFGRSFVIGIDSDPVFSTSLIDFYCKVGFVEMGRKVFDGMVKSDEVAWNTMIMGYATNGRGSKALSLFEEMRLSGLRPNSITFTGVLSACDHCGLIEEGQKWFNAMKRDYHIDPGIEHYSCMVDLLSRSGRLYEAMNLIEQMPLGVDAALWTSVLRGCICHGDKTLGKKVVERIIELDPQNSIAYVQLSGIFADSGDWERSAMVRDVMKEMQVQKSPGFSWADCGTR